MRPFKLTLILVFISFLQACATDSTGGYGWHSNAFVEKGWIEVDRFEPGNNTAFDRIDYERETKDGIDELIKTQGYPDYYMTTDLWDVYYGYLGTGLIYHLDVRSGTVLEKIAFQDMRSHLPNEVVDSFEGKPANSVSQQGAESSQGEKVGRRPRPEQEKKIGTGTGFFVSNEGHIVTNEHVISGYQEIFIVKEGSTIEGQVIAVDTSNDLALLKVNVDSKPLPIDFTQAEKGESVSAFGFPLIGLQGNELKSTFGNVNSLSGLSGDIRQYQIDTAVQPGSSGGPLLNMNGSVIGVISSALSQDVTMQQSGTLNQNVNYAVKIAYARPLLDAYGVPTRIGGKNVTLSTVQLVKAVEDSVVIVVTKN